MSWGLTPHIGKAVRWALAAFSPYATSALGPGWAVPSRATDNFSLFDDEEWNKTCDAPRATARPDGPPCRRN